MLTRIISSGQPGAEQAALDAAMEAGLDHGGWIARGRPTEAGPLPDEYRLRETASGHPSRAMRRNILGSDGTVVFRHGRRSGGCRYAAALTSALEKPLLDLDLERVPPREAEEVLRIWLRLYRVSVLHATGSTAREAFRTYPAVRSVLRILLEDRRRAHVDPFTARPRICGTGS